MASKIARHSRGKDFYGLVPFL